MATSEHSEEFEAFPLRLAYTFLIENDLANEANAIRQSQDRYKSYSSTLKRGKIITLLKKSNLLDSFMNECWSFGKTDKGQRKIARYQRVYDAFLGQSKADEEQDEEEGEENIEETSFALEEHLREYISKNLSVIESGLKLWKDKDGKEGIEYSIDEDGRRIDILAVDKDGIPVVIELKVSRGYQKVIGQCLYYKNRVRQLLKSTRTRIIIIAREISPELKTATENLADVNLCEYKISFNLQKIGL
jgi:hypothetical protein